MITQIKTWFAHSRTILAARMVTLAGGIVSFHDVALPYIVGTDISPLTSKLPQWALPMLIIGLGLLFEWLRRITTQSLAEKVPPA